MIIDCCSTVFFGLALIYFSIRIKKYANTIDVDTIEASDFTCVVALMPPDTTAKEVRLI